MGTLETPGVVWHFGVNLQDVQSRTTIKWTGLKYIKTRLTEKTSIMHPVKQSLKSIFWFFTSLLLWTPANLKFKFLTSSSKSVYFRFQSQLVHSQVAIITGIFVPFNLGFVATLAYARYEDNVLTVGGIVYAVWCFLMLVASLAVKKLCPGKGYLFQYVFLFLAFLATFQELGVVLYSPHLEIFESQEFICLFFILMISTLSFQWSTLITVIFLTIFVGNFIFVKFGYFSRNSSEVSARVANSDVLLWLDNVYNTEHCCCPNVNGSDYTLCGDSSHAQLWEEACFPENREQH